MKKIIFIVAAFVFAHEKISFAQEHTASLQYTVPADPKVREKLADWKKIKFGLLMHWGTYSQWGVVESWSICPEDEGWTQRRGPYSADWYTYLKAYENLQTTFNPVKFNPERWAAAAKDAGMKYVVFTAKHHSGFCMYNTSTTSFNVINTPFKRDILKEIIDAYRKEGIAIGLYYSPEDFHYFYEHNIPLGRLQHPMQFPKNNPDLMAYDKSQIKELLSNYGKIDILFIDGPGDGIREFAWSLQPELVITRDIMNTPEQSTPNTSSPRPWEACYTMGTDWGYKPTNDPHKTGTEVINKLIEIRAKGGNFLLNVGPKPNGEIQIEQESILQEVSLWNFANSESIYKIKPLPIIREDNIWYTQSNDEKYIYAYITRSSEADWKYGERKNYVLTHIDGNENTKVSILGFDAKLVEYKQGFDAATYISPTKIGLVVSVVNGQRFYTNNQWPNTVVLKIENAAFKKISLGSAKVNQSKIDGAN